MVDQTDAGDSFLVQSFWKYLAAPRETGKQGSLRGHVSPSCLRLCGHPPCCIWGCFVTPAALLSSTPVIPNPPVGFVSPPPGLAGGWGRSGQNTEPLLSAILCFCKEKLLLPRGRQTASCISGSGPSSLFILGLPSCSRIYKPNFDFGLQRHTFPFSPVSPLPGLIKASN